MFFEKDIEVTCNSFIVKDGNQILIVKEWGKDTVRITCSPNYRIEDIYNEGIVELDKNGSAVVSILAENNSIIMRNNHLKVIYNGEKLIFYYKGNKILEEYSRKQSNVRRTIGVDNHLPIVDAPSSSLNISPREFKLKNPTSYKATLRFEGDFNEKIFGLGGYQEEILNKNLGTYELMQRNSQTSIPFYLSNKNYGFIWNNASVGEVTFSKNQKKWRSIGTEAIDYIVTVGENPKSILESFTTMIGKPPRMSNNLLGLWQSKLRYQTLNEVEEVYNRYKERKINLSVLVIDYFHWTADGDFEFDFKYWKGIQKFTEIVKKTNTKIMVSLWPTVTKNSKYYQEYNSNKMLIQSYGGDNRIFDGKEILDFSNPNTALKLQELLDNNYRNNGIDLFWADQAEPEMTIYSHDRYSVYEGSFEKVACRYPYHYLKAVQIQNDKNTEQGLMPVLIRSAWFNSQKYGALAWSGDIESSFASLRKQIQIAINMGLSGVSWWTSDIAGFHSGNSESLTFKELMIRWFQFAVFSPILRMHGDRQPHTQRIGNDGGGIRTSGGPNEIWSFGPEVENVLTNFIKIREKLKPYIASIYEESSKLGYPLIRSLFLEFPDDEQAWSDSTNYMFGSSLLVAPVVEESIQEMEVYLPKGSNWVDVFSKKLFVGGQVYMIQLSIDKIPVFCRSDAWSEQGLEEVFRT